MAAIDKEQLVANIKRWFTIDDEIKELSKMARDKRQEKKELSDSIMKVMTDNEIDCFDSKQGKIVYQRKTVKSSLSKKHLVTTIAEYFRDSPQQASDIVEYILSKRTEKVSESLKRKDLFK